MVKPRTGPWQPLAIGAMVMIAVTGVLDALIAVNDGILPVPLPASPMEVLLLDHGKVVPLTELVKLIALVAPLLHAVSLFGTTISGVGLTVMVKFCAGPGQPFAKGVTVMVAVTGALVVLIAVNDGISPVPFAARPIEGSLLVQLKEVVPTEPVKLTMPVGNPLHTARLAGTNTLGIGFKVIVKIAGAPVHPFADGVTVIIAVTGTLLLLMPTKDGILPLPLAARPIEGSLFVQLKVVPKTAPVKFIAPTILLLQTETFAGCTTFGAGFTVI